MDDCIFCRILSGALPASFVYRDEHCAAFMDIQPVNPGHLLVIPIHHAAGLADLDAETAGQIMQVGQRLAAALRASEIRCEGINLFLADGAVAMQEVFHVHLHVLPRFVGDGFGLRFGPHYGDKPPRVALDEAAEKIRSELPAKNMESKS
jgi:histidine triad (HIT) family protein